jgi:hypothetical protein
MSSMMVASTATRIQVSASRPLVELLRDRSLLGTVPNVCDQCLFFGACSDTVYLLVTIGSIGGFSLRCPRPHLGAIASSTVVLAALFVVSPARANDRGFWYLFNSPGCGQSSCHIRGTEADVAATALFNIHTGEWGVFFIDGFATNGSFGSAGQIRMYNAGTSCGMTNSTNGVNRGFEDSPVGCFLEGTPVAGDAHTYRVQRKADSSCFQFNTPYCAGIYTDGSLKQEFYWGLSEFNDQVTAGALIGANPSGSEGLGGNFGLNGTMQWSRTSDVHAPGQSDTTWTTINSAHCQNDHVISDADWYVGSLADGFNIHFNPGGAGCSG